MKTAGVSAVMLLIAAPALAPTGVTQEALPKLPPGIVAVNAQPIEQDMPASLAAVGGVVRDDVRIHFAQRYVDAPAASASLGQLDSGAFAAVGERGKQLDACKQALVSAVDRLAADARKLGANGV